MTPPPPFRPEQLLEHGRSLRALARGLLLDEGAAEDVVQDAWVLALERPPSGRESMGSWLHTVVRNLALKRLRGERRRTRREGAAARPEGVAGTSESLESAAVCKRLVDAVLELDEPYRTAISMRYFDELPPREIARRLGLPKNTVRARLQRGLAQLRRRLDLDDEGERAAWAPALLVFAGLENGRIAAPVAQVTAGKALGVVTMAGLGKWAAGVIAVTALSYGLLEVTRDDTGLRTPEMAPADTEPGPAPELASMVSGQAVDGREDLTPKAPIDTEGLALAAIPAWRTEERHGFELQGKVIDAWSRPMAGAEILVAVPGQRFNRGAYSKRDGSFNVRLQAPTTRLELQLYVRRGGSAMSGMRSLNLVSGTPKRVHIDLKSVKGQSLFGRTSREMTRPLASAPWLHPGVDAPVRFRSNSGVDVDLPEEIIMMDSEISDHSESEAADSDKAAFAGVVKAADGEPAVRTPVGVKLDGKGHGAWTVTDQEGAWRIDGLEPGSYSLHAGGDDYGLASEERTVGLGELATWDPWLDRGRELRGRILVPDGELPAFLVRAEPVDPSVEWSDTTLAGADGRFAFPNAPAGLLRVELFDRAVNPWGLPLHVEGGLPADGVERDLVLGRDAMETASLSLSLRNAAGEVPAQAEVRLYHTESQRGVFLEAHPTEEDGGRYSVSGLPAGSYRLEAGSPPDGWLDLGSLTLEPGQELELGSFSFDAPGLLIASSKPEDLEHAGDWEIVHRGQHIDSFAWQGWPREAWEWADLEAPGWAKVQLPAGEYSLSVSSATTGRAWFPFAIESGGQTELELPLELLSDVTLRFDAPTNLAQGEKLKLSVTESESGADVLSKSLESSTRSFAMKLLPGSFRARLLAGEQVVAQRSFEVGEATTETIVLERPPR